MTCTLNFLFGIQKFLLVVKGKILLSVSCFSVKVNIGAEAWEKFYELIEAKGIKRKDIVKFIDSGSGIIVFPKDIIHLIRKYTIKQINLFKISFCTNNLLYNPLLEKKKKKQKKQNLKQKIALETLGNGSNQCIFFSPLL